MLNRLITVAIVLAIAYFLLTRAGPLLKNQFGPASPADTSQATDEDGRCVERAARANDALTRAARQYGQPPVDVDSWSSAVWEIESEIQSAAAACHCGSDACDAASRAIDEMRGLLSNLDGMIRGDGAGYANPANQQERIYDLLSKARAAAGF